MRGAFVATDVTTVLYLMLMALSMRLQKYRKVRATMWFRLAMILVIAANIVDGVTIALEDTGLLPGLLFPLNVLAFLFLDPIAYAMAAYVLTLTEEKAPVGRRPWALAGILLSVDALFTLTGALNGKLFTIVNGVFAYGPWSDFTGVAPAVLLAYLMGVAFKHRKAVGGNFVASVSSVFVIPVLAAVAEYMTGEYIIMYPALGVSVGVLFMGVQSGEVRERELREATIATMLRTDTLTGLNNRFAMDERVDAMAQDAPLHVLFCDLNGLKLANDNEGHAAGDRMLVRFTELLRGLFDAGDLYRVSGDEFVVLSETEDAAGFEDKRMALMNRVYQADRMAAIGTASGLGRDVIALVKAAEKDMYKEKSRYYIETGRDRRK
ncbi:MAG: GGDEF domain-containing protein [Clostridia bacterium]|nr:GGDEF domain-containing protein [Clostridia bacterium]